MTSQTSKEEILKRIRDALTTETKKPFPAESTEKSVYAENTESLDVLFAKQFSNVSGQFLYCEDDEDMLDKLVSLTKERKWNDVFCWESELHDFLLEKNYTQCRIGKQIDKADVGITLCEALIARTGSILVSSKQSAGRILSIYPPIHIAVAYTSQLVFDIADGLEVIKKKYGENYPSMVSFITGPSRTADIEKTLVLGAHGPKEVYVFLVEDNKRNN
ncbi:MAG: lactate utilization protein [Bacteroidetes bacterium]|nr:lactate utilization protein [Bacteroidota bacterium]